MSTILRRLFLRSKVQSSSIRNSMASIPSSACRRQESHRWDFRSRMIGYAGGALIVGGYYAANIERAPETGRLRFMALSQNEKEFYRLRLLNRRFEVYKGKILPVDHPTTQFVRRITQRLLVSSNLGRLEGQQPPLDDVWNSSSSRPQGSAPPDMKWIVLVVDDSAEVGADSALGILRVATGLMSVANTEEDLAAVIAHEIGHAALGHVVEILSPLKLPFIFYTCAIFAAASAWPRGAEMAFLHRLTLVSSPAMELEADAMALQLLARAGYDPAAAPRVIDNLITVAERDNSSDSPSPDLKWPMSETHPPRAERIAHMNALLPQAYELYNTSAVANGKGEESSEMGTTAATAVRNSVPKIES
ncbi:peptidase family M48-domain-containing protein [Mycena filopes]|nr:peptidase family M48-domain-containing protein [Mycena filopes]